MANTISRFKLMDGPSHVTLQVFMRSDGGSGELTNFVLLDPDGDISPPMPNRQAFTIKQIWYEITGFTITFAFNSLNPYPVWTLTPGASLKHDWRFFGGLRDYSSMPLFPNKYNPGSMTGIQQYGSPDPLTGGIDSDGKLLMTTTGFTDANDTAAFVLWIEKRDRANPQQI